MSSPITPLSLYITTELLMTPGFHWAIHITDPEGYTITRHEWAEDLSRQVAERYFSSTTTSPSLTTNTYTPEGRLIFAWFKVTGFSHPAANSTWDWESELAQIFPSGSYPTWYENRKHGMSCRTWVTKALRVLSDRGILSRHDTPVEVEKKITRISSELEVRLGEMTGSTDNEYVAEVVEI